LGKGHSCCLEMKGQETHEEEGRGEGVELSGGGFFDGDGQASREDFGGESVIGLVRVITEASPRCQLSRQMAVKGTRRGRTKGEENPIDSTSFFTPSIPSTALPSLPTAAAIQSKPSSEPDAQIMLLGSS